MQDNSNAEDCHNQQSNQKNSSYDLIFIAEDTIQGVDFSNFGFVFTNYVFASDKDENPKALSFSWLYSLENIQRLIVTIFANTDNLDLTKYEISQKGRSCVHDLSELLPKVISSAKAEKTYPDWIAQSGRQDVFDEFCRFMGLVDYLNLHKHKSHLILSMFEEPTE